MGCDGPGVSGPGLKVGSLSGTSSGGCVGSDGEVMAATLDLWLDEGDLIRNRST